MEYLPAANLLCNLMFAERTTTHLRLQMPLNGNRSNVYIIICVCKIYSE